MKKIASALIIFSLLIPAPLYAQNFSIGNTQVSSTTSVSGYKSGGTTSANASAKANLFGSSKNAFSFGTRSDANGGSFYINAGPYTWSGSNKSFFTSRNFTFLQGSGNFTLGPVPVTVKGSLGASIYFSLNAQKNYLDANASASGTGSAQAGVGISGWSAGVKAVMFPLLGGTLTAKSDGTGKFTIDSLKLYLRLYVEYLFGVGNHERTIADFGPLNIRTYHLW